METVVYIGVNVRVMFRRSYYFYDTPKFTGPKLYDVRTVDTKNLA